MNILKNASKEELSEVICAHRDKYRGEMWRSLGATVTTIDTCKFYCVGVPQSNANGVICEKIDIENIDEMLRNALAYFEKKHVPWCWLTGSVNDHKDFYTFLQSKGFKLKIEPGMGIELNNLEKKDHKTENVSIIKGETMEHVDLSWKVSLSAYGFPREFSEPYWKKSIKDDNRSFFVALLENKPVGISEVFYYKGVAGLYFVGVNDDVRGNGIGTAVTLAPLYEAKERGYQWAILHSSQMGFNMYKRIGFETICELGECHWIEK
ncbi:MAG: GNAT family N-acetyltransferase [Promethearchaeota archaeon]